METDKTDKTDRANFYDKEETGRRNSSSKNDLKILLSFIKGERRKSGKVYFTSWPWRVYTFSPRRMKIWPLMK